MTEQLNYQEINFFFFYNTYTNTHTDFLEKEFKKNYLLTDTIGWEM